MALPSLGGVLAEGDYTVIGVTLGAPTVAMTGTSTTSTPWLRTRRPWSRYWVAGYAYAFIDAIASLGP